MNELGFCDKRTKAMQYEELENVFWIYVLPMYIKKKSIEFNPETIVTDMKEMENCTKPFIIRVKLL